MIQRKPEWLRVRVPAGESCAKVKNLLQHKKLHTVCESAHCPNQGECWNRGTATFLILGNICTRDCHFCAVKTGRPHPPDNEEPQRVADAAFNMKLKHAVITSVTRDDLTDGGAEIWAATIRKVRRKNPQTTIEVLIPDFKGDRDALWTVLDARPDILNHNIETVPRLYPSVRPQAAFERSVELLSRAKEAGFVTKTGMMLGIGEREDEIENTIQHLAKFQIEILTLGQYLSPTKEHLPVARWVSPEEFTQWKVRALELGFKMVESGPLVRSSYRADRHADVFAEARIMQS